MTIPQGLTVYNDHPKVTETTPLLTSHPIRVLLIDDQMIIGEAVRRMLASEPDIGFQYCSDPTQAIATAQDFTPTIILLDLVMPEIDGLMLARFLRANSETHDVPLVMLSTKEDPQLKAEAFAQGVNDYLVKLPDQIELLARIRYHSKAYINLKALTAATTTAQSQAKQLEQTLQELQQAQSQLIQTEKMSSLGQMVAGIAHEINNPVNFIYGNLEYANRHAQDLLNLIDLYQKEHSLSTTAIQEHINSIDLEFLMEDLPKILSSMKVGAERIRQIVLSLRNFSRLDEAEVKCVDVHEGLDSTLLILSHRLKQGVEVIKCYGELPMVACYPAQLNQVFMNIINNAVDALLEQELQEHKQITVQTESIELERVHIKIRDNGPGIPAEIQDKLFNPFFTTKPVNQGTGLGLSICHQIVEKHQGKITVSSTLGQGTEFLIDLPIHQPIEIMT